MANGDLQGAGLVLQGLSAGLGGRGIEFQDQLNTTRALDQEQERERRKTVFTDSLSALNFAKQGRFDLVVDLGQNRLQASQQFPGVDFKETEQLTQLAQLSADGDIEAQRRLVSQLEDNVQIGQGLGILQGGSPQDRLAGLRADKIERELAGGGVSKSADVQSSDILPNGSTVQVFKDGSTRVTGPQGKILKGLERQIAVEDAQEFGVSIQARRAEGRTGATESEKRAGSLIARGISAAESTATVRRAINLLDRVKTGGIQAISLATRQRLGIEGADEGELSNSLGKAVLSQLRETFGAAFTQTEGERLGRIEAGFGKSTENNRRLLGQALRIAERTANRAIKAAESRGNQAEAADIRDLLSFTLDVPESVQQRGEEQQNITVDF